MNIFDQAMKFELKGFHYYKTLARRAWDPSMKDLFSWLAVQEEHHFRLLLSMKKAVSVPAVSRVNFRPVMRLVKSIENKMVVAEVTLSRISAYRVAVKMEEQSGKFYRRQADLADRGPIRSALLAMAREEERHAETIEYLLAGMEKARKRGRKP